ncbi:MAG: hypothetical protein HOP11_14910 [Saprospiraceae bacterium]|nr:hypothetical protein [Saprospiraceae bacterium]
MKIYTLVLVLCLLLVTRCKNDDDCVPPILKENVIGTWSIKNSAFGFSESGSATFYSDGKVESNPKDFLISGEINGVILDKTSFTVIDSVLKLKASSADGTLFISESLDMTKNECDEIVFDVFGGLGKSTYKRK